MDAEGRATQEAKAGGWEEGGLSLGDLGSDNAARAAGNTRLPVQSKRPPSP